ncbi:hypothetical protein NMG60_11000863 [Bertholletia excelsa]
MLQVFMTLPKFSSVLPYLSQQVQGAMESMLKIINEIDENSTGIMEEIEKCKENALEKKKTLEEQRESFQNAAYAVLEMLNKDIR